MNVGKTYAGAFVLTKLVAFLIFVFATTIGYAQSFYSGFGSNLCRKYLQEMVHTDVQISAFSWAQGFIAGINVASINERKKYYVTDGLTGMEVLKRVTAFCVKNPDKPFIAAADALLSTLPKSDWRAN